MQINKYLEMYKELEVIGSGSFGSASLVKVRQTGELQVAKKIDLTKMSEKERNSALREVQVLKSLNHPNIVSYKGSFIESNQLIILMEYCEEGDLNYHIKKRKDGKKIQYFPEKLILNWLIQLLFALQHIHQKRILHRDIKTSNVFLTSNGTVKLGDFGVSKILENTMDIASTLAGTPYYMSPEVCENKPYTFKSDVWALGCVLYELCTFKYAFDAKNILGLISKILQDQAAAIPSHYSKDLQNLIHKLLSKQVANRPIISDIINMNFVQQVMNDFITNGGRQSYCTVVGVKKTKSHSIKQQLTNEQMQYLKYQNDDEEQLQSQQEINQQQQHSQVENQSNFSVYNNTIGQTILSQNQTQKSDISKYTIGDTILSEQSQVIITPKEKLRLKKEEEIKKRQLELSQAAQSNREKSFKETELRRIQHLQGTNSNWFQQKLEQLQMNENENKNKNQEKHSQLMKSVSESQRQLVDECNEEQSQSNEFLAKSLELDENKTLKTQSKFMPIDEEIMKRSLISLKMKKAQKSMNNTIEEEQMIVDTIKQQDEEISEEMQNCDDEEYYESDFEDYGSEENEEDCTMIKEEIIGDEMDERLTARQSDQDLQNVVEVYKNELQKAKDGPSQLQLQQITEENESINSSFYKTDEKFKPQMKIIEQIKENILKVLPQDVFNQAYQRIKLSMLSDNQQKGLKQDLINIVGKKNMNSCFNIEQLLYREQQIYKNFGN